MNTQNFKRRLTAILSADVEGYSRLMRDDEDETVRTITAYRAAIAKLVEQYRGRVVDSPGDNILVEFGSGLDAVNCAVEIQRELAERNEELADERKMKFRIGVNLGDVIQEDERIYGDGVNIAARIESLAEGGGISISGTVYDSIEGKLGLEFENLGEHEVKNIDKLIRVYRILSFPGAAAHRVVKAKKAVGKTWRNIVLAIAAVLILGGGALGVWHYYLRPPPIEPASVEKMAFPLPDNPSIAVLPFDNMSGDPEQELFCDGLTEDIITALSNLPRILVIARNSSFVYKGKSVKIKQVAEELGVKYVLEGSFRKSGDKVRITAQLIDATTGHHLWADRYDRELKDIFDLQDEITQKILTSLDVKLADGEQARSWRKTIKNPKIYEKSRQALEYFRKFTPGDNHKAREMWKELVALDPEFIHGYGMLGWTYLIEVWYGWSKIPKKSLGKAAEFAQKVLDLDESIAEGPCLMGCIHLVKREYDKAVEWGQRSVDLSPNGADVLTLYAVTLGNVGRWEEAISLHEKAIRLNPLPPIHYLSSLGACYSATGRYEDAIKILKRALKINPEDFFTNIHLTIAYSLSGRESEAKATAKKVLKLNPKFSLGWYEKTLLYKNLADKELIISALRKAGLPDKSPVTVPDNPSIAVLPFANISGDPKEDYLSDGITEQIITALSKIPKMLVIARNSVFTYKGKPVMVQQVSEELGVRYVLEGSVQKEGDRLRITAQLINAKTGNHLWSERYDRELKDLFDLQDDVTKNVITALQVKLTEGQVASILGKGTDNLEAYLMVMKGVYHNRRFNKDDNEIAQRLFGETITLDPDYANAYVFLAWTYRNEAFFGWTKTPAKSYEKAVELAKKAISLDEQNANAYMVFANVYAQTRQFEKAAAARKKALALDPANSSVIALSGMVLYNTGKFKEAILFLKKAIRIDPKHPSWYVWLLGVAYTWMGQNEKAIAAFNKWVSRAPENADAHAFLGVALITAGKPEEAIPMFDKALSLNPDRPGWYVGNLSVARACTGQTEEAITTMREVFNRNPKDADSCRYLSVVLIFGGRHEEALVMAKKAVTLKEMSPSPDAFLYDTLGTSYRMMGQYEEAIAAFKKTIDFWPEYIYGQIGLTASYSLAGRMEVARAQAAEVLKINPKITLEDIAKNGYCDYKKTDKERFINTLSKAGLK